MSRRNIGNAKADKFKALKEARSNGSRLHDFEINKETDVYDVVDEVGYDKIRRHRMQEEDFVVDDDGLGYADYGQEEWDEENPQQTSDESETEVAKKRKRKKEKSIKNMLTGKVGEDKGKGREKDKVEVDNMKTEDDLMNSIFKSIETEGEQVGKKEELSTLSSLANFAYKKPKIAMNAVPLEQEEPTDLNPGAEDDANMGYYGFEEAPMIESGNEGDVMKAEVKMEGQTENKVVSLDEDVDSFLVKEERAESTVKITTVKTAKLGKRGSSTATLVSKFARPEPIVAVSSTTLMEGANASEDRSNTTDMFISESGLEVVEEDGSVDMFWLDATEMQGVVYLFGKVLNKKDGKYVSCSVSVTNMQRNVFVLPRDSFVDDDGNATEIAVEEKDVSYEFNAVRKTHKISHFDSVFVQRHYAFELPNVPATAKYLKVVYPFQQPQLPASLSGKTFSRVFGTNTSALELFIRKRRLMGPCWCRIAKASIVAKNVNLSF